MDLKNKLLDNWLKSAPASAYPNNKKEDHYTHYKKLKDYLLDNVHNDVTIGANLIDPDILLNDHGPKHVETVIKRASDLLQNSNCKLSAYEVYILLCSIEVHDIGNIFGRFNHEKKSINIILNTPGIVGRDNVETKIIRQIAEAHGGRLANDSKDKIANLNPSDSLLYGTIRTRLIASILRFADELADDATRANTTLLLSKLIPSKSEVFHAYAHCLQSVIINQHENTIQIRFEIPKKFLLRTFGKMGKTVLLMNEIYDRMYKMHLERKYCMSFTKGEIDLEKIRVEIQFYDDRLDSFIPRMIFDIQETGYPEVKKNIFEICPELTVNGIKRDGGFYKKLAKK